MILILAHPRTLRMLLGFLIGGLTISMIAGIGIVRAIGSSGAVDRSNHTTKPVVSIVLGSLSLLVAWGIATGAINRGLRKHRRPKSEPTAPRKPSMADRALSRGSLTMAFVAGLVLNLPGVWYGVIVMCGGAVIWWRRETLGADPVTTHKEPSAHGSALLMGAGIAGVELLTAFPYFAAIGLVLGSSVASGAKVFLLFLYNLIYIVPLIAIVVVRAVMGERGAELLVPVCDWIQTRWPMVVAPVAGVAGAGLTTYGIVQLT